MRIEAIGLNYIDTYYRTGLYPQPLPYVPGLEGAGVVTALGSGVSGLREGDRVAWANAPGSYAETVGGARRRPGQGPRRASRPRRPRRSCCRA